VHRPKLEASHSGLSGRFSVSANKIEYALGAEFEQGLVLGRRSRHIIGSGSRAGSGWTGRRAACLAWRRARNAAAKTR
jgi:hypothetical protein